jgi:hypothetical protein
MTYRWSSYRGYIQKQHEEEMVDYRWRELLGIASESWRRKRYRKYVESFVSKDDDKTIAGLQLSPYAIGETEGLPVRRSGIFVGVSDRPPLRTRRWGSGSSGWK